MHIRKISREFPLIFYNSTYIIRKIIKFTIYNIVEYDGKIAEAQISNSISNLAGQIARQTKDVFTYPSQAICIFKLTNRRSTRPRNIVNP